jgi:pyruvate kinase
MEEGVDFVALSFVRHERDLDSVIAIIREQDRPPLLIAKIETPQALDRIEAILERVDGIMVARGDLGVEMPLAEVPLIQKRLIQASRKLGKPVITATQMLRSMVDSPRPTRAEATDVANAILDGTDAVMLSEESATGRFPAKAVEVLNRIAIATEPQVVGDNLLEEPMSELLPPTRAAVCRSAIWLARDLEVKAIMAFTVSGSTARTVAKFRAPYPLIAFTPHRSTERQLSLSWGVTPVRAELLAKTDDIFSFAESWARRNGVAEEGERLVLTAGVPPATTHTTNVLKVIDVG